MYRIKLENGKFRQVKIKDKTVGAIISASQRGNGHSS